MALSLHLYRQSRPPVLLHNDSVGRVCHFPHYFPPRRSVCHGYHRGGGYRLARKAKIIRFECSTPLHTKNRLQSGFSACCTLVEDVRTAVQHQSAFWRLSKGCWTGSTKRRAGVRHCSSLSNWDSAVRPGHGWQWPAEGFFPRLSPQRSLKRCG
jgi:hypothetical protein